MVLAASAVAAPLLDGDPVITARTLATTGHRADALALLDRMLASDGGDTEALLMRGIILSWDRRYDEARRDLHTVLARKPNRGDALSALINLEMWSDHPDQAERLAAAALRTDPANADLLLARAKALDAMARTREAVSVVKQVIAADPANRQAVSLKRDMEDTAHRWEAGFSHTSDWFSDGRQPWREEQVQLSRETSRGSVIGRFSQAGRFGLTSQISELDWYPHLRRGTYAYVNAGYSADAVLYPQYRLGFDLFQSLGGGWEGSGGFRRLGFRSKVNIYTAALSRYHRKWLFTARTYLTPDSAVGTSYSLQFSARRYLRGGRDYWGLRGGWGSAPAEIHSVADIGVLNSTAYAGEFNKRIGGHFNLLLRGGLNQEDRVERAGLYRYYVDLGLYYRF